MTSRHLRGPITHDRRNTVPVFYLYSESVKLSHPRGNSLFGNPLQSSEMKKERLKIKTERIEFFSDAVIAIIITLMVLEIRLPEIEDDESSAEIFHQLKEILPNIFAFMISFAVLGVYWVNHHQFFKAIEYSDWKLLWYNLHFLFWCSLIPLSTAL